VAAAAPATGAAGHQSNQCRRIFMIGHSYPELVIKIVGSAASEVNTGKHKKRIMKRIHAAAGYIPAGI
jgi:hypothetical protein